ncbi:hypothetical protein HCU64_21905 [Methylobacterium sp. C25]|uniref:hypothetical protein n=1 Tax=Methylobacterium sp. C25 TaxID=2721622 RepID=UPI001F2036FA|nr:hypothetical protein [Methylobacterium sp. C25]MCE4226405.1 hypothetical protein [Methylobacterium sp. C25]
MSPPLRKLRAGRILVAAVLIAGAAAWLQQSGGASIANGVSSVVDGATAALKAVNTVFHSRPAAPDAFASACAGRGGTVVEARNRDGMSLRRCATSFDDGVR